MSGLRNEVRLPVRMLNLAALNDVFGLAKIQEQYIWSTKKSWRINTVDSGFQKSECRVSRNVLTSFITTKNLPIAILPYHKAFEAQMQERR